MYVSWLPILPRASTGPWGALYGSQRSVPSASKGGGDTLGGDFGLRFLPSSSAPTRNSSKRRRMASSTVESFLPVALHCWRFSILSLLTNVLRLRPWRRRSKRPSASIRRRVRREIPSIVAASPAETSELLGEDMADSMVAANSGGKRKKERGISISYTTMPKSFGLSLPRSGTESRVTSAIFFSRSRTGPFWATIFLGSVILGLTQAPRPVLC